MSQPMHQGDTHATTLEVSTMRALPNTSLKVSEGPLDKTQSKRPFPLLVPSRLVLEQPHKQVGNCF